MKRIKVTWLGVFAFAMIIILAVTFIGRITGGFTKDWEDVTLRERNPSNLLSGTYGWTNDKYNVGDGITITASKDGTLVLDGEYKGASEKVIIPLETVSLSAGTYTISGAPDGGNYSYYLCATYNESTVIADFGAENGTFTLTQPSTVTINLVCFGDSKFDDIKIRPVLVDGTEAGEFFK